MFSKDLRTDSLWQSILVDVICRWMLSFSPVVVVKRCIAGHFCKLPPETESLAFSNSFMFSHWLPPSAVIMNVTNKSQLLLHQRTLRAIIHVRAHFTCHLTGVFSSMNLGWSQVCSILRLDCSSKRCFEPRWLWAVSITMVRCHLSPLVVPPHHYVSSCLSS